VSRKEWAHFIIALALVPCLKWNALARPLPTCLRRWAYDQSGHQIRWLLVLHHWISKTNMGSSSSAFGIWHKLVMDGTVPSIVGKNGLVVKCIHTHIGLGSNSAIWQQVAKKLLSFCATWDSVELLNLGVGYKVGHNPGKKTTGLVETLQDGYVRNTSLPRVPRIQGASPKLTAPTSGIPIPGYSRLPG
jgi:hypothetical protein